jgi:hypothetical protein
MVENDMSDARYRSVGAIHREQRQNLNTDQGNGYTAPHTQELTWAWARIANMSLWPVFSLVLTVFCMRFVLIFSGFVVFWLLFWFLIF